MPVTNQLYVFMAILYVGLVVGIIYEIKKLVVTALGSKFLSFVLDFIYGIIFSLMFFIANLKFNLGEIRLFLIITYIFGFYIERISIGYIVTKTVKMLYNIYTKICNYITKSLKRLFRKGKNENSVK